MAVFGRELIMEIRCNVSRMDTFIFMAIAKDSAPILKPPRSHCAKIGAEYCGSVIAEHCKHGTGTNFIDLPRRMDCAITRSMPFAKERMGLCGSVLPTG